MWNVSESTVKRWADSKGLHCRRTPGGHRRFLLHDLQSFQQERGFEATGILTTVDWEDPTVEVSLNQLDFEAVREQVNYLAARNQRSQIKDLLERLYLRGASIVELYDRVLVPVELLARHLLDQQKIPDGQARLIRNNLEESMYYLFPQVIRKKPNGKTGLCATPDMHNQLSLNAISRILEVEGWESLNLGSHVSYESMAEMVQLEPVNLVCVVSFDDGASPKSSKKMAELARSARDYRIPLVFFGPGFEPLRDKDGFGDSFWFKDLDSLRDYISGLNRH